MNNVDSSIGGQLIGMATFLPLGFLSGYVGVVHPQEAEPPRVPPEVELAGLDVVEYGDELYFPEVATPGEMIIEPDGEMVPSETVLRDARDEVVV